MAKRQEAQGVSASSNRATCVSSGYTKMRAERRRGTPGTSADGKARLSAYLNLMTSLRPKERDALSSPLPSVICTTPSTGRDANPRTVTDTSPRPQNTACTLADSVISFCRRSLASCAEMSAAVPGEGMFLLLVRLYGVLEAKYWAEALGLKHSKSYAHLAGILYGEQFSNRPNVIRQTRFHRGCNSKA
jgi:hypothetical protein